MSSCDFHEVVVVWFFFLVGFFFVCVCFAWFGGLFVFIFFLMEDDLLEWEGRKVKVTKVHWPHPAVQLSLPAF